MRNKTAVIRVDGEEDGFDFDAHYKVDGHGGIAFYALGWEANHDEDGELERSGDSVVMVMVGDDRRHVVDRDDCTVVEEDGFCRTCGQIGCGCNVYA